MARPLRLERADGVFHVMARGDDRQAIFRDDEDHQTFLRLLSRTCDRYDWELLAFSLMRNHYHLVIRTRRPTLARGMQYLNGAFARHFNQAHGRVGHVFQGRYKSLLIDTSRYLREALRYVALNPVRAGFTKKAADWAWSSHAAIIGRADAPPALNRDAVLLQFGDVATYRAFIAAGDPREPLEVNGAVIGDPAFARESLPPESPADGVARRDWAPGRPSLVDLLSRQPGPSGIARAHRRHGYTLSAIAGALNVHVTTVSRRLVEFEGGARAA